MGFYRIRLMDEGVILIEDERRLTELIQSAKTDGFLVYTEVSITPSSSDDEPPIVTRAEPAGVMLHAIQRIEPREYAESGRPKGRLT